MKKYLLLVCLFYVSMAKGQIVNIPDANFKSFLISQGYDTNNNGEIEQSEANLVNIITMYNQPVSDMTGIRSFTNLVNLTLTSFNQLTSLDLTGLAQLSTLSVESSSLNQITLSGLQSLNTVIINCPALTNIDFTGTPNLINLTLYAMPASQPDLNTLIHLKSLTIDLITPGLSYDLDFSALDSLESLTLGYIKVGQLLIPHSGQLGAFECDHVVFNNTDEIDLAGLHNLSTIQFSASGNINKFNASGSSVRFLFLLNASSSLNIQRMDFSNCNNLSDFLNSATNIDIIQKLDLTGSNISTCDLGSNIMPDTLLLKNCTRLGSLLFNSSQNSRIRKLNLEGCHNIGSFSSTNFTLDIDSLDLSQAYRLSAFKWWRSSDCRKSYINLKNGSTTQFIQVGSASTNDTLMVCADQFEVASYTNYLQSVFVNTPQYHYLTYVSANCTFFPGGNPNEIGGTVQMDLDQNGCTPSDQGVPNLPVLLVNQATQDSIIWSTQANGQYVHYPGTGNYQVSVLMQNPYFTVSPSSSTTFFDTINHIIDTVDFCLQPIGVKNDMQVLFYTLSPFQAGYNGQSAIKLINKGNTVMSGTVQLQYNASRITYLNSSQTPVSSVPGTLIWNYSNLLPFQSVTIDQHFYILPPPVNNIFDSLYFDATVNPVAGDETPADNHFAEFQVIGGPYDPNDKTCLEGDKIDISQLTNHLHYLIRFQNLGNAYATNILITDTLASTLDWNSFQFLGASHPCQVKRTGNKLEFQFPGIQLPWEALDEPNSHGYVIFSVRPRPDLLVNDSINNTASIYFDFNLPVRTNTAVTVVTSFSPVPVTLEYFKGTRLNKQHLLNWKASCSPGRSSFELERSPDAINFSPIGQISTDEVRCLSPFSYTDTRPLSGKNFYRLKIRDEQQRMQYSRTILLNNNMTGWSVIYAIAMNKQLSLSIQSEQNNQLQARLFSSDGRMEKQWMIPIKPGDNLMQWPLNLAHGLYFLNLTDRNGVSITQKIIM